MKEADEFRDRIRQFDQNHAMVLGISTDSPSDNLEFKKKHSLPYPLLCDVDRKVSIAYGTAAFPSAYYSERVTFVIAPDGIIRKVITGIPAQDHAVKALEVL
jgi:peroxiredoxin Q/BCP